MSHQPVFSIITVTYNAERWLERTILSVLSQSYTNVEYLIIDGGGLRQATGDYLVFLNAGDTFHTSDTLNQIVNGLQRRKSLPDVIYGETRIVDAEGKSLGMRRLKAPKRLTWKSFKMGMLVSADYDWCLRCLKSARSVYNARTVLSDFLEAGLSTTNRKASLRERYEIMCRYYGKFQTILLHGWFAIRFYWAKWVRGRV